MQADQLQLGSWPSDESSDGQEPTPARPRKRPGPQKLYSEPRVRYTVRMPDELIDLLDADAVEQRSSRNAVIERIVHAATEYPVETVAHLQTPRIHANGFAVRVPDGIGRWLAAAQTTTGVLAARIIVALVAARYSFDLLPHTAGGTSMPSG